MVCHLPSIAERLVRVLAVVAPQIRLDLMIALFTIDQKIWIICVWNIAGMLPRYPIVDLLPRAQWRIMIEVHCIVGEKEFYQSV